MNFHPFTHNDPSIIQDLFTSVFTDSEGADEGNLVGKLARNLLTETEAQDLYCFVAMENQQVLGSIMFSRLTFEIDINAFLLAPVAVRTDCQGRGIGQQLISFGLDVLRNDGAALAVTYGDPTFYSKVGFQPLSQEVVRPPHPLSQPIGWLGQSLTGRPIKPLPGVATCVTALDDPAYW